MENKENNFSVRKLEYRLDPIEISAWFKKALDAFKEDQHEGKSFDEETRCMESLLNKDFNNLVKSNNYSSYSNNSSYLTSAPIFGVVSLTFTFCPKKQTIEFVIMMIHRNNLYTDSPRYEDIPRSEYVYNIPKHLMDEYNILVCPYTDAEFSEMILVNKESNANYTAFHDKDGVLIEIDIDNVLDPVFGYLFSEIEKF